MVSRQNGKLEDGFRRKEEPGTGEVQKVGEEADSQYPGHPLPRDLRRWPKAEFRQDQYRRVQTGQADV